MRVKLKLLIVFDFKTSKSMMKVPTAIPGPVPGSGLNGSDTGGGSELPPIEDRSRGARAYPDGSI